MPLSLWVSVKVEWAAVPGGSFSQNPSMSHTYVLTGHFISFGHHIYIKEEGKTLETPSNSALIVIKRMINIRIYIQNISNEHNSTRLDYIVLLVNQ